VLVISGKKRWGEQGGIVDKLKILRDQHQEQGKQLDFRKEYRGHTKAICGHKGNRKEAGIGERFTVGKEMRCED